jgi:ribosomal-protein-alanine N-acetyltransferase
LTEDDRALSSDSFLVFPQLETERLLLRELKSTDAEAMYRYLSDPEVTRYLATQPHRSLKQTQDLVKFLASLFQKGEGFRWGITLKAGDAAGVVIGTCGYHAWAKDHFRAEIGYELAHAYWGQGIMAEAMEALLAFGFEQMTLHRVEAMVLVGNRASARFLEKLGFQQEAVLRDYEFVQGRFRDVLLFSLLRKNHATHLTS